MAQLLIRDLDPEDLERLKARARRDGRSLQAEAKRILQQAARQPDWAAYWGEVDAAREALPRNDGPSMAELIRKDRER